MRQYSQSFAIILASLTAFPAAVTPIDAFINNALSLPVELNEAMIVDEEVTQDIAELRGQLRPFILGVVTVYTLICQILTSRVSRVEPGL